MPKVRRRIKLIQPRLQLKLVFASLGICLFGLVFECLFFAACLAEIAVDLPTDGPLVLASVRPLLVRVALVSCAGILPLVFIVGVLTTFRIAGRCTASRRSSRPPCAASGPPTAGCDAATSWSSCASS
jgi:hypothetical protein